MDLSLLLAADYASATVDGKLYIMGVFTRILAQSFPVTHPDMCLVVQLSASRFEIGRNFKLDIKLVDEDMNALLDISVGGTVPEVEKGQTVTLNNVLKLVGVVFPAPGNYEFSIQVDQDLKGTMPIEVLQVLPPQA